ncbi:hypothetical protein TDIS_1494 [Thermosulfurimonas dismutans]|uniref:Uncharacterized protein n=1 Tax=Thermosulfurimonas dismutans TaxID=999894 RepID=A0A179D2Z7_9BACT|nr:hypothetical protein TDIS_1494 [Thermosulfurimonas dismutans]
MDLLIRELSEAGITVEVFYLDDEPEASESLSFNPSEKPNQGKAQFP